MNGDLPLVVGTAGHVDHGKTSLIRALTGVDTDRLQEEKRRGMTIDLGFAPFRLPGGRLASVVDVPGHERFLKNMLAGVPGMDVVLLVVAADDGVMPQTREHLDILTLLGVREGIVVVTKIDLVDGELRELAIEDIREALTGTPFEHAPVESVSTVTGEGLEALLGRIEALTARMAPRDASGPVRLPVDRVFVKQGFGTVVTGTLQAGTLREGEVLSLWPGEEPVRVRGLQVHGGSRERAVAGQRVAVNLVGVERADLVRGAWIVTPGVFRAGHVLDVAMRILPDQAPLKHRTRVRVHHGTAEALGRVHLLEGESIAPGTEAIAQLLLEEPLVAAAGDRLVLRLYAPVRTVGGGEVLLPVSRRARRRQTSVLGTLTRARAGDWTGFAEGRLRQAGTAGMPVPDLADLVPPAHRARVLEALVRDGTAIRRGERLMHRDARGEQAGQILAALASLLAGAPWRSGVSRETLQARLRWPLRTVLQVLEELERLGELEHRGRLWMLHDHVPRRDGAQVEADRLIGERIVQGRFLSEADALAGLPVPEAIARDLLDERIESGEASRLGQGMLVSADAHAGSLERLRAHFARHERITTSEARELLETNRKSIIPYLEHLDTSGFTRRGADFRVATPALMAGRP